MPQPVRQPRVNCLDPIKQLASVTPVFTEHQHARCHVVGVERCQPEPVVKYQPGQPQPACLQHPQLFVVAYDLKQFTLRRPRHERQRPALRWFHTAVPLSEVQRVAAHQLLFFSHPG